MCIYKYVKFGAHEFIKPSLIVETMDLSMFAVEVNRVRAWGIGVNHTIESINVHFT